MSRKIALWVALALCLLLSACGQVPSPPPEPPAEPAESAELLSLRSSITAQEAMLGVGFFGYIESGTDEAAVQALVAGSYLAQSYPFLQESTIVLTEGAELYAFVPADENTAITICPAEISQDGHYIDHKEAPIYTGQPGETIILRCNLSEIGANVLISAMDGKNTLEFHPIISLENGRVAQQPGCCDFSLYEQSPEDAALEYLLAVEEVQQALAEGMALRYTGSTQQLNGVECLLFALGTNREEQFVQERLYAASDSMVYRYSPLEDHWVAISAG